MFVKSAVALKTIGRHLIAEFYGCDARRLDDLSHVKVNMMMAAEMIGASVVGETFHKFAPQGVSGTVVIAESHLSIHTWPEAGYVAVDIYTCGGLDPWPAFTHLGQALAATSSRVQEIARGLPGDIDAARPWLPKDVQIITRMAGPGEMASVA